MAVVLYPDAKTFNERVADLLSRIEYRRIETDEDRERVFRLRYEAYRREEAIPANLASSFSDEYDELDNVWIFGVFLDGRLISSIRMHRADGVGSKFPSLTSFEDILTPELSEKKVLIDPTRFVTDSKATRLLPGLPHLTLRLCWICSVHFNADHFLVAIRPEHQSFYRRTFRHQLICPARNYPMLASQICLMTVRPADVDEQVYKRYPFYQSTDAERKHLFDVQAANDQGAGELSWPNRSNSERAIS